VDPQTQRALSRFYQEELERHLNYLKDGGFIGAATRDAIDPAYQRILANLHRVCGRDDFPILAEALLRNLDLLSGLSGVESRTSH
jgi:hypothetical protein